MSEDVFQWSDEMPVAMKRPVESYAERMERIRRERIQELIAFMIERHSIYRKRERGEQKPWTTDPILSVFRFTNIYRELDTETMWIAQNWRDPHADDPDLWFALAVARLVNWHDSLAEIGYPVPWNPEHFVKVMEDRQARGEKVYTGAYMVHADRDYAGTKAAYLAAMVLGPMWRDRESLRTMVNGTLAEAHARLMKYRDMGSFMAGQVIADLKYVQPLRRAPDWRTWAASGPGSRRGLNRLLGRDLNASWTESSWLRELQHLHAEITPVIRDAKLPPMHAQDLQGCLCEMDKMWRVRNGEGKPRSKYPGQK